MLLKHPDKEVRLVVIQRIVHVMRIAAPHDPYNIKVMKEVFQFIDESFQGSSDIHNPSFGKVVQILESVARLRACVIMIDLACEDLILDMFYQFLISIKRNHKKNVI